MFSRLQALSRREPDAMGIEDPREARLSALGTDDDISHIRDRSGSAVPKNNPDWQERHGVDSAEMIDDPVRMYLREIGRVSLLKAAQERTLAREMEACKHIEMLEGDLTSPEGAYPEGVAGRPPRYQPGLRGRGPGKCPL